MDTKNNVFTITRELNAPIELLWKSITDISAIKQWSPFFPDFKAEVGFETSFLLGPDPEHQYVHLVKVIEVLPGKKLTYTWQYKGYAGSSYVSLFLEQTGDKTTVTLTHTITEAFPSDPAFSRESFATGWTYTMDALQKFVEKK